MSRKSKKKVLAVPSGASTAPIGKVRGAADFSSPQSKGHPAGSHDRWTVLGVCIFLAVAIWVVFGQTLHHGFVNFDDDNYVYENPEVTQGLTLHGIVWAFTHDYAANWHPLTWISHMLDCQLYGLNPAGHHLTNILFHTTTVILLFLVLRRMTGAIWRSAFVAAVFAIHPLRVESVAWVAERKDVLSGVFCLLTIGAYVRYVQRLPRVEARGSRAAAVPSSGPRRSILDYCLVLLFFALGLMCKPMLVTLPFVLFLLDYWPLNRVVSIADRRNHFPISRRLILEKLPLLGMAAGAGVATLFAQTTTLAPFAQIPFATRVGNALISYVAYLGQMFWPSGLAVVYPLAPGGVGILDVVLSLVLLAGISTGVFVLGRRRPYFMTGWLWYLIMLAPVVGIIQVGAQARADRYTYLPQIGLYLLLTWAAADLCANWRHHRVLLGGLATVILIALTRCAHTQAAYWRDNQTLWTHTLACTSDNFLAHNNLGAELLRKGDVGEAIAHFQRTLQINPDYAEAHINLGDALFQKGDVDEAIAHYQQALQIKPDYAEAHNNLGNALLRKGDVDRAILHYQRALQISPDYAEAHIALGEALLRKGDVDDSIAHFQKALQIKPGNAFTCYNLANALLKKGDVDEAIAHFRKALQIKPDYAEACNNLGNALLRKGIVDEAMAQYQSALQIDPDYAEAHYNLGSALLQKGDVDEAIAHFQKALQIKPDYAEACNNLGNALLRKGNVDEAIAQYQKAVQIKPDNVGAHNNLGFALLRKGRVDEAIAHFQKILQIEPANALARDNLGNALLQKGAVDEAISEYRTALQINPDYVEAQKNLAWVLATCPQASLRNGNQAVELAQRADQLTSGRNPLVLVALAAAYGEVGRFPEAVETAQRALQLAKAHSDTALSDAIQSQLKLYQAGIPFRSH